MASRLESGLSWRLFTEAATGFLVLERSDRVGEQPKVLTARFNLCDQQWHQVRLDVSTTRIRLIVDGYERLDAPTTLTSPTATDAGLLWVGCFPATSGGCDGMIGDVQLIREGKLVEVLDFDTPKIKTVPRVKFAIAPFPKPSDTAATPITPKWAVYAGAHFTRRIDAPETQVPHVTLVTLPNYQGAFAIWGALGRDQSGDIWVSGASHYTLDQSAHLFRYNPTTSTVTPVSDALTELKRARLYRLGEQQVKIHTKFILGKDGALYFATMDDPKPGLVGEEMPRWGSHLWRIRPGQDKWDHLFSLPEGLIALAGNGTQLYGLGFPDHTLFRFDVSGRQVARVKVGSVEGHVSRHLLCDHRGHVYVPRLKYVRPNDAKHTLVEFDQNLQEVAEHPLPHYQNGDAQQCHGIVAYQPLIDQSIAFTTHAGRLFRLIVPSGSGSSQLQDLGWFHPSGKSYASGLFAISGERELVGVAMIKDQWSWVCFDLNARRSRVIPLPLSVPPGWSASDPFLYGCTTRDNEGDFYIGGAYRNALAQRVPVLLRIRL